MDRGLGAGLAPYHASYRMPSKAPSLCVWDGICVCVGGVRVWRPGVNPEYHSPQAPATLVFCIVLESFSHWPETHQVD